MVLPLYSALVRPCLEYYVQMWSYQYRRNVDLLDCIQSTATEMIQGIQGQAEKADAIQPGEQKGSQIIKLWPFSI